MPQYGLIGDSSLYCKSSSKKVKRIGSQLQEQLATNDLWYHAVANAGVGKILHNVPNFNGVSASICRIFILATTSCTGRSARRCAALLLMHRSFDRLQTRVEGH